MTDADHDLLIKVHTLVLGIQTDIKDMRDDTRKRVDDHEIRIRGLEFKIWLVTGGLTVLSFATPYIWSFFHR